MDRMRQFTEHNLMPLENKAARAVSGPVFRPADGGGTLGPTLPYGSPSGPSIPWYQQIVLHRFIVTLLTEKNKSNNSCCRQGWVFRAALARRAGSNAFSRTAGRTT